MMRFDIFNGPKENCWKRGRPVGKNLEGDWKKLFLSAFKGGPIRFLHYQRRTLTFLISLNTLLCSSF